MNRLTLHHPPLPIIILVLLALILLGHGTSLLSNFWSNTGWLQLTEGVLNRENTTVPTDHFLRAIQSNQTNARTYLGIGMAYAENFSEPEALNYWRQGQIAPATLHQLGSQMRKQGLLDLAFIYFRNAAQLDPATPDQGDYLAGRLCQQSLTDPARLSAFNQQYCHDYFAQNGGNLLLDGQFDQEVHWGWTGDFLFTDFTRANFQRDLESGVPSPSLRLTGLTSGRHAGLYQRISILPGTKVRFSGYFRSENAHDLSADLLYIERQQEGKPQGNSPYKVESSTEWQHLERIFVLPMDSEPWAQFYPVLLRGEGTVWADNLSVEIVSELE